MCEMWIVESDKILAEKTVYKPYILHSQVAVFFYMWMLTDDVQKSWCTANF